MWTGALLGLLRLAPIEQHLLLPLARLQQGIVAGHVGAESMPILVDQSCSGADIIALVLAACLAFPVGWPQRLRGAATGLALILGLNIVRISSLAIAAGGPLFEPLHVYVWPIVLAAVSVGYVAAWTRVAQQPEKGGAQWPALRFLVLASVLVTLFMVASPWLFRTAALGALSSWVAGTGVTVMRAAGVHAWSAGPLVETRGATFLVTPACVTTPLIPLALAAVLALRLPLGLRLVAAAALGPLFTILAVLRLLVLAVPPEIVESPLPWVHGFNQLVLGATLVLVIAWWRRGAPGGPVGCRALLALGVGVGFAVLAGPAYTHGVLSVAETVRPIAPHILGRLTSPGDTQGALVLLPGFQASLLLSMTVAAFGLLVIGPLVAGSLALFVLQLVGLGILGEAAHAGVVPGALLIRAWGVAAPLLILGAISLIQSPPAIARGGDDTERETSS